MAAGAGNQAATPQDARPGDEAAVDRFLYPQGDVINRPHIARRGNAGIDQLPGQHRAPDRCCGRTVRIMPEIVAALLREMDMEIDQSGHDEQPGCIDGPVRIRGKRRVR